MTEKVRNFTRGDVLKDGELVIHAEIHKDGGSHNVTQIISKDFLEQCGEDAVRMVVKDILDALKIAQKTAQNRGA